MNWPTNVIKKFVRGLGDISPSCKQVTRLQSAALDRELLPGERFGLKVHLIACKWCRSYGNQINFLRSVAKKDAEDELCPPPNALSPEARDRIKRALQSQKE